MSIYKGKNVRIYKTFTVILCHQNNNIKIGAITAKAKYYYIELELCDELCKFFTLSNNIYHIVKNENVIHLIFEDTNINNNNSIITTTVISREIVLYNISKENFKDNFKNEEANKN